MTQALLSAQQTLLARALHFDVVEPQQGVADGLCIAADGARGAAATPAATVAAATAAPRADLPVHRCAIAPIASSQRQRVVHMNKMLQ